MTDNNILWIFLHLPKAGGTTLKGHWEKHTEFDVDFFEASRWGIQYRRQNNRPELEERSLSERSRVRFIGGHFAPYGIHRYIPDRTPRYFTFVREPASRLVSLYNFRRSRGKIDLSFADWYAENIADELKNPVTRFYAELFTNVRLNPADPNILNLAKNLLSRCWLATTTEDMDRKLAVLFGEMGLPTSWQNYRVAGAGQKLDLETHLSRGEVIDKHVDLTDDIRDRIYQDSPLDAELYEWVRALPLPDIFRTT